MSISMSLFRYVLMTISQDDIEPPTPHAFRTPKYRVITVEQDIHHDRPKRKLKINVRNQ